MASRSASGPGHPNRDRHVRSARGGFHHFEPAWRPFWDVLGTWEDAPLEVHEVRYLECRRSFLVGSAEKRQRDLTALETAINIARVRREHQPMDDSDAGDAHI